MSTALCLALLTGAVVGRVETADYTLTWTHSIEKIEWQEDWRVEAAGLRLLRARVRGSGAGMDPPSGAVRIDGWWQYDPGLPLLPSLQLARSGLVDDHLICVAGQCRSLGDIIGPVPRDAALVLMPCATDDSEARPTP